MTNVEAAEAFYDASNQQVIGIRYDFGRKEQVMKRRKWTAKEMLMIVLEGLIKKRQRFGLALGRGWNPRGVLD